MQFDYYLSQNLLLSVLVFARSELIALLVPNLRCKERRIALDILVSGNRLKKPEKEQHLTPSPGSSVAALPPRGFARPGKRSRAHPHCQMASSTQPFGNVLDWKTLGAILSCQFEEKTRPDLRPTGAKKSL